MKLILHNQVVQLGLTVSVGDTAAEVSANEFGQVEWVLPIQRLLQPEKAVEMLHPTLLNQQCT